MSTKVLSFLLTHYFLLLLCDNEKLGFGQFIFICLVYGEAKKATFTFKSWNPVFVFGKVPENVIKRNIYYKN